MLESNATANNNTNKSPFTTSSLDSNCRCRNKAAFQWFIQIVLLHTAAIHSCVESDDVVLADGIIRILGKNLLSGPDFMAGGLLLLVVFHDDLAHSFLEVQRTLLHLGVELAVDEDAGVEVLLAVDAEVLVLGHDSFVHVADEVEGFVAGILVAIDFVSHHGPGWADRSESLHEEEVGTEKC